MPPIVKAIPEGYEGATPYLISKGRPGPWISTRKPSVRQS